MSAENEHGEKACEDDRQGGGVTFQNGIRKFEDSGDGESSYGGVEDGEERGCVEVVPESDFADFGKVFDESPAANDNEGRRGELDLHIGEAVVAPDVVVAPDLDHLLGIDASEAGAETDT